MSIRGAILWSYGGAAAKIGGQFALTIVLARLLGPEPYGLLSVALLPMGLGMLIADAGLGSGLVQKRTIDRQLVASCMWWQMAISLGLAAVVAAAAVPLTAVLHAEAALPLMLAVTLLFPINATAQISSALLKRDMRFRELQVAAVAGLLVGNAAVGLPLALGGAGPWALVAAIISQASVTALVLWRQANPPWGWSPQPWPSSLARFGAAVIGLNLANWTITNAETVALSRLQGPIMLGAYSRLTVISTGLVNLLIPPLQNVLLAHHSRQQNDLDTVRRQWLRTVGVCAAVLLALAVPIASMPETIIGWTLGEQWRGYGRVLAVLGVALVANGVMGVCGPTLQAIGYPGREFLVQGAVAVLAIPSLIWAAATQSLLNFAFAVSAIALLRCAAMLAMTIATLWRNAERANAC